MMRWRITWTPWRLWNHYSRKLFMELWTSSKELWWTGRPTAPQLKKHFVFSVPVLPDLETHRATSLVESSTQTPRLDIERDLTSGIQIMENLTEAPPVQKQDSETSMAPPGRNYANSTNCIDRQSKARRICRWSHSSSGSRTASARSSSGSKTACASANLCGFSG